MPAGMKFTSDELLGDGGGKQSSNAARVCAARQLGKGLELGQWPLGGFCRRGRVGGRLGGSEILRPTPLDISARERVALAR